MMKRLNHFLYVFASSLASALPFSAYAHTGLSAQHGEDGAMAYWFHLLTEPDHLALLAGSVALLLVVGRRAWRTRQASQRHARTKAHHDAR